MHDARALSRRIASLLAEERNSLADFLVALAEFDRQRGWATLGYASLFQYLERELKLTSSAAARRMTAATLVQRFPAVVEPLRDGRVCMSVVYEISKAPLSENSVVGRGLAPRRDRRAITDRGGGRAPALHTGSESAPARGGHRGRARRPAGERERAG